MAAKIFRINYKSDFILTLNSDAGWMTPFCIKFWTGAPSQAFFVGWDGETYTHCAYDPSEPTKLLVQFDDHHLPTGDLKFQIAYHFTMADFPNDTEDEVINPANITTEIDGQEYQVMLDFTGETAPEIQFSLPAYANEAQRIANEQQRIANEEQRITDEQTRIDNEALRISAEQTRQDNEAQRIQNEQTRINQEESRVREFATLKRDAQEATTAANDAASLANQKAQLAADKAQLAADKAALAQDAANLANQKAQLANDAAALANEKATLANQKAEYADLQGDYAKDQGDYAKQQGDYAKAQAGVIPVDVTRSQTDATFVNGNHDPLFYLRQANSSLAGLMTAAGYTKLNDMPAAQEVNAGLAYDVSVLHPTSGVSGGSTYASLSAALAVIPQDKRKGGMTVKFVLSSDNKYVQYRLMVTSFSTDVSDWQGVDDEPTVRSNNLVKSGGVFEKLYQLVQTSIPSSRTNVIINNVWNEQTQSLKGVILPIIPGCIYKLSNKTSGSVHYKTDVAILQSDSTSVGTNPNYSSYYPSLITVAQSSDFIFTAPQDANYLYAKIKDAYGNRTLEFGEYVNKVDTKEDLSHKVSSITSPNQTDYPSTQATANYVNTAIEDAAATIVQVSKSLTDYAVCGIEGNTPEKAVSLPNYVLTNGGALKIKMANANTADNATLNINSTGSKALIYNGARASASNTWRAGEVLDVYYDAANEWFVASGKIGIDNVPIADSSNTVKSGGVFNSLYAYQPINLPSERTNIINGNKWDEKTQQLQGIILKITPGKSYKFYNDSSANIHYSTEIAILQTNDVTVGTTPSYSSSYPSPITVNGKREFKFEAPQDGNWLYAKIKDAYGNRTLEFGEYADKFDLKEDTINKKQSIDSPNGVDYPSTLAVSNFVNKVIRETVRQFNYTASTSLNETLFNTSEGDKVIVTISASLSYGIKFKLYSGDDVVQQETYYSAVENAEFKILNDGVLKVEVANTNTNSASIKVELINYGTAINKVVSYVGNYQQDDNVFNLTNPSVNSFLSTNDYDNNDYTNTYVNSYNSKSFYRKDWPLPVILRWEPVNSTDTYILLSDSTPVVPVTWESNEYPKSDFWFNVPSGVFSFKIYNLVPNKTYYYVIYGIVDEKLSLLKQGSFTTEGKVRMLNIPNLQNVRDLGGWNANGGTVAYDMLFRGTAMDAREATARLASEGLYEMSFRLAIKTDIDLRGDYSRYIDYDGTIKVGSPLGVDTKYYPKAISPYDAGLQGQSATNIGEIIEEINTRLSSNRKVYIHCAGGCDRTETLCYLILGLLGVSESDLAKEYELTSFANADGYALGKYRTRNSTVYRFPQFVSAIKQYNGDTLSDKIETFLLANGVSSTTISSLRTLLVVPSQS